MPLLLIGTLLVFITNLIETIFVSVIPTTAVLEYALVDRGLLIVDSLAKISV
jgi:hypothetical protein